MMDRWIRPGARPATSTSTP